MSWLLLLDGAGDGSGGVVGVGIGGHVDDVDGGVVVIGGDGWWWWPSHINTIGGGVIVVIALVVNVDAGGGRGSSEVVNTIRKCW